jgi:hypothetical protein
MPPDFEDIIRQRMADAELLPDGIIEAGRSYTADFDVRGTFSDPADQWGTYDEKTAATGLYFPDDGFMLVDNRGSTHHNDQWNRIREEEGVLSPILPWASARLGDSFIVEVGRSHGGLYQALSRKDDLDDVTRLNDEMTPEMVLDVAYAARLTDHPPSGEIEYIYVPQEIRDALGRVDAEDLQIRSTRETSSLGDMYDLLRTSPAGLPDPLFDRSEL